MTNSNIPEDKDNQQNSSNNNGSNNPCNDFINLIDSEPISNMRSIYEGFSLNTSINKNSSDNDTEN